MEITKEKIKEYSQKYDKHYKGTNDEKVYYEMVEWCKHNRFLDKERFLKIINWKLAIKIPLKEAKEQNKNEYIQKITKIAFSSRGGEERIKLLLSPNLIGVGYPVASTILHFAFPDKYPILDKRVLWSLGEGWKERGEKGNYNFDFWQKYCKKIEEITKTVSEDIRTIDKALWEYSKEHQSSKI